MSVIGAKKTLNLHKYSIRITEIISNWKIIVPIIFAFSGIVIGCFSGKGESGLYLRVTEYFTTVIMNSERFTAGASFLYFLIYPAIFAIAIFFLGLCVFGALLTNAVPLSFGFLVGCISFFLYNEYTLKGLAYCIIMLYPYCVLSMLAVILCCRESINMSEYIVASIAKTGKFLNYGFAAYYKTFLRNFIFIIAASAVKTLLDYLFGSLFAF